MKIHFGKHFLARGHYYQESPTDLTIETSREHQDIKLLRALHAKPVDRGNLLTLIRFSVTRKHNGADEAKLFALTHASALTELSNDAAFVDEDGPRAHSFLLNNAVVRQVSLSVNGITTTARYELRGGAISQQS